jgi:hypothetical protein
MSGARSGEDKDGPTIGGWRMEELLQSKQGGPYPSEGTFGVLHRAQADVPLLLLETRGSGGIAVARKIRDVSGAVGRELRLTRVGSPRRSRRRPASGRAWAVTVIMDQVEGCVTSIEPGPNGSALLGAFSRCIWCTGPMADIDPSLLIDLEKVV